MKFKHRYDYRIKQPVSIDSVVEYQVEKQDYGRGALEDVQESVRQLTEIVSVMAKLLPESAQIEIAAQLGFLPVDEE